MKVTKVRHSGFITYHDYFDWYGDFQSGFVPLVDVDLYKVECKDTECRRDHSSPVYRQNVRKQCYPSLKKHAIRDIKNLHKNYQVLYLLFQNKI